MLYLLRFGLLGLGFFGGKKYLQTQKVFWKPRDIIYTIWSNYSDLTRPKTPNCGLVREIYREIPLFQGNLGWRNIIF